MVRCCVGPGGQCDCLPFGERVGPCVCPWWRLKRPSCQSRGAMYDCHVALSGGGQGTRRIVVKSMALGAI
eukprot:9075696-Pyramimonas_sp.AAC.1